MKTKIYSSIICSALLSMTAQSAVIVNYAMTAAASPITGPLSLAPTAFDANVTATLLSPHPGGTTGSLNYAGGNLASTWVSTVAATGTGTTFAQAVTSGNYLQFSISPVAGQQIALTNITFRSTIASNSTTSDRAFYLVSETAAVSFSNASTVLRTDRSFAGGGGLANHATVLGDTVLTSYDVSLAALPAVTGERFFRLYLQTPTASQGIAFDDIIVNGTVSPIPEPSSFALLAGGLILAGSVRRRSNS